MNYIKNKLKNLWQRMTKGWDDSDTWNLDLKICEYILPRLKRLKQLQNGHPASLDEKQWDEIMDKIIYALDLHIKSTDDLSPYFDEDGNLYKKKFEKDNKDIEEGLSLLGKWLPSFWW